MLIKDLIRSKGLMLGLILLFFSGIISLQVGKTFTSEQQSVIQQTAEAQKENIDQHLKHVDSHIGLLLYYIKFGLANEPSPIAGLTIGQRDVRQAAQLINIRNLEEQKNTKELFNPYYKLLGNMDFSFVLIYLFPLIIIALCFNLLSEEKEHGRWSLLSVQSYNPIRIIRAKLFIRWASVSAVFFVLYLSAIFYLDIPFYQDVLVFGLLSLLYIIFWFSLSWWVTSLDKSSNQNALILLSSWILLTTIIPAIVNNVVTYSYPIADAYETTIDSRDGYHNKWDEAKEPTIEKFKKHYPQFSKYNHPVGASFGWFWYYAMQQMGDDESANARQAMQKRLDQRNRLTQRIGYFVPSIHTQLSLNALCKTDMQNHINYMEALEGYHEKLRLKYYPKIFDQEPISDQDWESLEMEHFIDSRAANWYGLLPLLLSSLMFILSAMKNLS